MAAVDEAEVERGAPARGDGGGVAHHADDAGAEAGPVDGGPPEGQGVDATGGGIDHVVVVVVPARLVLLGSVVVVDAEETAPVASAAAPR